MKNENIIVRRLPRAAAGVAAMTFLFSLASAVAGQGQSQAEANTPQEEPAPKSFEVASIKPSAEDGRRVMVGIAPGGRYTAAGVTIKFLIQQAFDVKDFQITGGPGWLNSERYDINAKAETPQLNRDKIRVLLQSLLAERCNLKFHRETRELPIYALVIGKNGPKLHKSDVQPEAVENVTPPKAPPSGGPEPKHGDVRMGSGGPGPKGARISMRRGQVEGQMAGISEIASLLAPQLGRPVVDKTGLNGKYDFKLEWTPDEAMRGFGLPGGEGPGHEVAAPGDSSGPSIFTAVQEQLGLKLESEKGPVEIIVIEQIDRPSAN